MAPSLLHQDTAGARVLLLGDSLAQGLGPPLARLADAAGVSLVTRGVQSSTIRQWLAGSALVDAVTQANPMFTLVSLGTNDMRAADPGAEGRRAGELIDALVRTASAPSRGSARRACPSTPARFAARSLRCAASATCGSSTARRSTSSARRTAST